MKKRYILSAVIAISALAACSYDDFSRPAVGAPPPDEPVYETEVRYLGTAPFCAAKKGDCYNLGGDWEFDGFTKTGSGSTCATGTKVKCTRQVRVD